MLAFVRSVFFSRLFEKRLVLRVERGSAGLGGGIDLVLRSCDDAVEWEREDAGCVGSGPHGEGHLIYK